MIEFLAAVSVNFVYLFASIAAAAAVVASTVVAHFRQRGLKKRRDVLVQAEILGIHNVEGVPDKAGMADRLGTMDIHLRDTQQSVELLITQMADVHRELHPNHGTSMRDDLTEQGRLLLDFQHLLDCIAAEVETFNGIPMGELAERQEGRRIRQTTSRAMRTTSEQEYVDQLPRGGRNAGHDGPLDRTVRRGEDAPHTEAQRDEGAS